MFLTLLTWIILGAGLILAGHLTYSVFRSGQSAIPVNEVQFFLPNDFFVSLVLLTNFWMILLVLLGSHELLDDEKHMIIIIASLLAPFLSWWRKKKAGVEQ